MRVQRVAPLEGREESSTVLGGDWRKWYPGQVLDLGEPRLPT